MKRYASVGGFLSAAFFWTLLHVYKARAAGDFVPSALTLEANGNPQEQDGSEDERTWLCRITKPNDACGYREYFGITPPQYGMFCPDGFCCSKTKCVHGSCGSWCSNSWALCSTTIVYHKKFSYGNCNCSRYDCGPNAVCVSDNRPHGGVYCKCKEGFLGNGTSCNVDYCWKNPCGPGSCERTEVGNVCHCPETHKVVSYDGQQGCAPKAGYCVDNPCGSEEMVKKCIDKEGGYDCECNEGYVLADGQCQSVDLCASSPCGPQEAVDRCMTEHDPRLQYHCICNPGYELTLSEDGMSETCIKDWCYDEPCGGDEKVESCESTENGYSCVCKEGYTLSSQGGREQCVQEDLCASSPCGPPEAVAECYLSDTTYGCRCQSGYAEVLENGAKVCRFGNPCSLGVCGPEEAVKDCSTDGSSYVCNCSAGFTAGEVYGMMTCIPEKNCDAMCGSPEAVKSCSVIGDKYNCICNPGYHLVDTDGSTLCVNEDACHGNPCGPEEAVKRCVSHGSSFTCECEDGYETKSLPDGSAICALVSNCSGDPCGSSETVESCVATSTGYKCICADGFHEVVEGSSRHCVSSSEEGGAGVAQTDVAIGEHITNPPEFGNEPSDEIEKPEVSRNGNKSASKSEDTMHNRNIPDSSATNGHGPSGGKGDRREEKKEQGKFPTLAVAGGIAGVLLLGGLIGAGVAYKGKFSGNAAEENVETENEEDPLLDEDQLTGPDSNRWAANPDAPSAAAEEW